MRVVDSHTEGEPTRVIVSGGPELGDGPLSNRLRLLSDRYDEIRQSVIYEPRGSEALVGALLCPSYDPSCTTGVIFFNNVGYLGMCGHGAMGVVVTLAWLGLLPSNSVQLETPSGIVKATLKDDDEVTIENVNSYRYSQNIEIEVDGFGLVQGDVAWGGNWFFITESCPIPLRIQHQSELLKFAVKVKETLAREKITGADHAEVDHIELIGSPQNSEANARNFVLCPGNAFDRSPCGTGTSAKLACLAKDGSLEPGAVWVQESIIGSRFIAYYEMGIESQIIPKITGHAYVCADSKLIRQQNDPFKNGISFLR